MTSIGIALLFAGLFFEAGGAQSPAQATPVPTLDRLAEPTLPPDPSQADFGSQVYWLSCLPCHGDKGQGLTDEFRATYPPEDQYCWESGCHGKRPYDNGFTIPTAIPGVIGPEALSKFSTGAQLQAYIRAAMPFWRPGSLSEEEAWKVTAFILRQNGLWSGAVELNDSNAGEIVIARGTPTPSSEPPQAGAGRGARLVGWVVMIGFLVLLLLVIFILKKFRNTATI